MKNPLEHRAKARRVIMLVQEESGAQRGWEVFDADVSYEIIGYPSGSAHGRISAHGEFHQMRGANIMDEHTRMFADEIRGELDE